MFGFFKRKRKSNRNSKQAYILQKRRIRPSQLRVLRAIHDLQPCNYRDISTKLQVIDGSVTNRISELKKRGLITVAFTAKRLGGSSVSHYKTTLRGERKLFEDASE